MRILLDENFPADFAGLLAAAAVDSDTDASILTIHTLGWSGVKNGELLRRAREICDVFVTLDRNLEFQQNIRVLPFGVVVVQSISNRMVHLAPLAGGVLLAAGRVAAGTVEKMGDLSRSSPIRP